MSYSDQPTFMPQRTVDNIHADMRHKATNERLEMLLEQAKEDSAEQQRLAEIAHEQTRQSIRATWVGIGVATVVGVASIAIGLFA